MQCVPISKATNMAVQISHYSPLQTMSFINTASTQVIFALLIILAVAMSSRLNKKQLCQTTLHFVANNMQGAVQRIAQYYKQVQTIIVCIQINTLFWTLGNFSTISTKICRKIFYGWTCMPNYTLCYFMFLANFITSSGLILHFAANIN